jgi:arylsulfatase A-like enzyme
MLTRSPWLSASLLALALLCTFDLLWPARRVSLGFLAGLIALGLPLALLHGLLWSLVFWLVRRVIPRGAWMFWFALSGAGGTWLAHELGAFTRLHSRYQRLAWYVLIACGLGALGFGSVCTWLQPTRRRLAGSIADFRPSRRRALAGLLVVIAFGLAVADRRLFTNLYLVAHTALRVTALWSLMFGLYASGLTLGVFTRWHWLVVVAAYAVCVAELDERRVAILDTFASHAWPGSVLALNRMAYDWDGDGYASVLGAGDCAPFDPKIHPGAREIPDNGIDENCILGDAKSKRSPILPLVAATEPVPMDVVLITLDALHRGHIGLYDPAYGPNGRATTPNLDRWAEHATVFEHAYTPGGWTSIAIGSLMRGVWPRRLHWQKFYETNLFALLKKPLGPKLRPGEESLHMFPLAFDDPHPPLPEILQQHGMYTMAVVDDGWSAMLQRGTGIERGFDVFREMDEAPEAQRDDAGMASAAIELLKQRPAGRHFFLWVHFFGTHWPNDTHPGYRQFGTTVYDLYDHEVVFLDSQLTRLLSAIDALKTPTAVFLAADHGEGLTASARFHGQIIEEQVLRIPMLARVPGWPNERVRTLTGSIDLVPTILALTKTPAPAYLDGIDLASLLGAPREQKRVLFSDTWRFTGDGVPDVEFAAAYDGQRAFVLDQLLGELSVMDQTQPLAAPHLISSQPNDPLAAAVYAYVEDTGGLDMAEH